MTQIFTAKVQNGVIVTHGVDLPEGAEVTVFLTDDAEVTVTPEQEAMLRASIAQADRGERIPASEVLAEMRRR